MRHVIYTLPALALALVACGEGSEERQGTQPPPTERPAPTSVTTEPAATTAPRTPEVGELASDDQETVESAMADLAERTGAEPAEIRLVSFEHVTWNDGSLGCPEPGKMYTQALVEGSRTVLGVDDQTYDYHASRDADPFLCEQPRVGSVTDPTDQ